MLQKIDTTYNTSKINDLVQSTKMRGENSVLRAL
jgi:hypothetical protein